MVQGQLGSTSVPSRWLFQPPITYWKTFIGCLAESRNLDCHLEIVSTLASWHCKEDIKCMTKPVLPKDFCRRCFGHFWRSSAYIKLCRKGTSKFGLVPLYLFLFRVSFLTLCSKYYKVLGGKSILANKFQSNASIAMRRPLCVAPAHPRPSN